MFKTNLYLFPVNSCRKVAWITDLYSVRCKYSCSRCTIDCLGLTGYSLGCIEGSYNSDPILTQLKSGNLSAGLPFTILQKKIVRHS